MILLNLSVHIATVIVEIDIEVVTASLLNLNVPTANVSIEIDPTYTGLPYEDRILSPITIKHNDRAVVNDFTNNYGQVLELGLPYISAQINIAPLTASEKATVLATILGLDSYNISVLIEGITHKVTTKDFTVKEKQLVGGANPKYSLSFEVTEYIL